MPDCSRSWHPPWPRSGTRDTSTTTTLQRKLHATTKLYAHVHVHCPQGDHTASLFSVHVAICGRAAVCARNYVWVEICVELWKPLHKQYVRLSLSVSRFVLDWKGLGREGGWVEGGIIYVPAARWSWSPRPPATQLCCAASHQQFHQHQHQHQRQGIYAYTHVVQCQHRFVCLDIQAFL